MLSILFQLICKVVLLTALGYILRKTNYITEQFQKDITKFMMDIALPANILTAVNNTFSSELSRNLLLVGCITVGYYLVSLLIGYLLSRRLALDAPARRLFITLVVFANIAFIGFPLTTELLGTEGTLYNALSNMLYSLFFYTVGISLISGKNSFRPQQLLKVPAAVVSLLTCVLYFLPVRLPDFLIDTCSALGSMVVPISMMIIGCSLAPIPLTDILKDKYAYLVSFVRLLAVPFGMLFLLRLIPGLPAEVILVTSLLCALPTGSMCVIFATEYQNHVEFASRTVVQEMLLMIVTVPLFTLCAVSLLGLS